MIQSKELRIGNLVFDHLGRVQKVAETRSDAYICYLSNGAKLKYKLNTTQPIPLTEEWLLNFGFKLNGINYELPNFRFHINKPLNYDGFVFCDNYNVITEKIKYVHQLQNLYFALTGEELAQVREGKNKNLV